MTTMPHIGARRLTLRRAIVAALLVPMALTLAACDSSPTGPQGPASGPAPDVAQPTPTPTPLAPRIPAVAQPTHTPAPTPDTGSPAQPTVAPTTAPTQAPTSTPTAAPTTPPTQAPTAAPTQAPTFTPTPVPTLAPTFTPTPTTAPTSTPTPPPPVAGWRTDIEVGSRVGNRALNIDVSGRSLESIAAGKSVLLYFFATW